jgi:hypothetical protein
MTAHAGSVKREVIVRERNVCAFEPESTLINAVKTAEFMSGSVALYGELDSQILPWGMQTA